MNIFKKILTIVTIVFAVTSTSYAFVDANITSDQVTNVIEGGSCYFKIRERAVNEAVQDLLFNFSSLQFEVKDPLLNKVIIIDGKELLLVPYTYSAVVKNSRGETNHRSETHALVVDKDTCEIHLDMGIQRNALDGLGL